MVRFNACNPWREKFTDRCADGDVSRLRLLELIDYEIPNLNQPLPGILERCPTFFLEAMSHLAASTSSHYKIAFDDFLFWSLLHLRPAQKSNVCHQRMKRSGE